MNEVIEAVRYDLVQILADLLVAADEATAVVALAAAHKRIDAAFDAMEVE